MFRTLTVITRALLLILNLITPVAMVLASPADPSQNSNPSPIVGFQEWKRNRVFDARKDLDEFKSPQLSKMAEVEQAQTQENVEKVGENPTGENAAAETPQNTEIPEDLDPTLRAGSSTSTVEEKAEKLRQLEFNLEIAQGLTIHDYFALYLKNKSKEEMALAIQKLSPGELSELLMAYRQSLYGVPVEAVNANANGSLQ